MRLRNKKVTICIFLFFVFFKFRIHMECCIHELIILHVVEPFSSRAGRINCDGLVV